MGSPMRLWVLHPHAGTEPTTSWGNPADAGGRQVEWGWAERVRCEKLRGMSLRIGIAGIAIESSTFSPHRAGAADFDVRRGDRLLERYDFLRNEWADGVEWVPLVHGRSLPGGAVVAEFYDE